MNSEHIAMRGDVVDRLLASVKTYPTVPAQNQLLGIPVVIDDSLPPEPGWELRNECPRASAEEIRSAIDWIDNMMGRSGDHSDS